MMRQHLVSNGVRFSADMSSSDSFIFDQGIFYLVFCAMCSTAALRVHGDLPLIYVTETLKREDVVSFSHEFDA